MPFFLLNFCELCLSSDALHWGLTVSRRAAYVVFKEPCRPSTLWLVQVPGALNERYRLGHSVIRWCSVEVRFDWENPLTDLGVQCAEPSHDKVSASWATQSE